jgi:hypothetical protein
VDVVDVIAVDEVLGASELLVDVVVGVAVLDVELLLVEVDDELVEDVDEVEELVVGTMPVLDVVLDVDVELVVGVGTDVDVVLEVLVVLVTLVLVELVLLVVVDEVLLVDVADVLVVVTVARQPADATLVPMRVLTVSPRTRSMFARPPAFRWQ